MTCHRMKMPGGWGVVCVRGQRSHKCRFCGEHADRQCDYALKGIKLGRTCSAYVCSRCAPDRRGAAGEQLNYCPPHARILAGHPPEPAPPRERKRKPAKPKRATAQPEPEQLPLEGLK